MYLKSSVILMFVTGCTYLMTLLPNRASKTINTPEQEGIAVVELFTSQGCSSCPSADRLLSKLINETGTSDHPVFGLSFHVDYWNRLGWRDPYSSEEYTQRQYAYGRKLKLETVYTPQMIVNGKLEFVGSNERLAKQTINKVLASPAVANITVEKLVAEPDQITLNYTMENDLPGYVINAAIVERGISTDVKRGENHGRILHHDNVVRVFQQQEANQQGIFELSMPEEIDLSKSSLILYGQNLDNFEIGFATKVSLDQLEN